MRKFWRVAVIFLFVAVIYLTLTKLINFGFRESSTTPYYNYLTQSFLSGKINIILPPNTYDLTFINGKWFLYWGPAPVLVILPFYVFLGNNFSDVIYTLLFGFCNTVIFYFLIKEFLKYFKINLSSLSKFTVLLSFAFASPNFYLSLAGRIWHTSQVIAIFYLLLFLFFFFVFLNLKQYRYLVIATLLFCLAWFTRFTLIFYALIFLYPLYINFKAKKIKELKEVLAIIIFLNIIFAGIFLSYNYVRFGNIFETGFASQHRIKPERYNWQEFNNKFTSVDYLAKNLYFYYVSPFSVLPEYPFLKIDKDGNSVLLTYPLLLTLVFLFKRSWKKFKQKLFLIIGLSIFALSQLNLLLFASTGSTQFGNRYFFDVIPILFIITLFVIELVPSWAKVLIVGYGFIVNILGTVAFYSGESVLRSHNLINKFFIRLLGIE